MDINYILNNHKTMSEDQLDEACHKLGSSCNEDELQEYISLLDSTIMKDT